MKKIYLCFIFLFCISSLLAKSTLLLTQSPQELSKISNFLQFRSPALKNKEEALISTLLEIKNGKHIQKDQITQRLVFVFDRPMALIDGVFSDHTRQVYLDIEKATTTLTSYYQTTKGEFVEKIDIKEDEEQKILRVEILLKKTVPIFVFYLENPFRLVVDLGAPLK